MDSDLTAYRCCILNDGSSIGLFRDRSRSRNKVLAVVLSAGGTYTLIKDYASEEPQRVHITKFVPEKYFDAVKYVILFRNSRSVVPYLCERFFLKGNN